MAEEQQRLGTIRLKGNHLIIRRFGKDGQPTGKKTKWKVKTKSNLPRELFFKIRGFLQQSIKRYGTESLTDLSTAGGEALKQAGRAFGCEIKEGSARADLYWFSNGARLFAWQIHAGAFDKRRARKLEESKALLRLAVIMKQTGFFKIVPRRTRLERS